MSAFRRRTTFAAPLIVTVAACSSGGKSSTNNEKPKRFPGRIWSVSMQPDACMAMETELGCPPNVRCNPPPPQVVECPPGSSGRNVTRIAERSDKTCAVLPPACVDEKCLETPTACPLPFGEKLPPRTLAVLEIELENNGECHVEEKVEGCMEGAKCNPPSPRKVACPPGITVEKTVDIAILVDGSCAIVPEGCETEACVGAKTECPK